MSWLEQRIRAREEWKQSPECGHPEVSSGMRKWVWDEKTPNVLYTGNIWSWGRMLWHDLVSSLISFEVQWLIQLSPGHKVVTEDSRYFSLLLTPLPAILAPSVLGKSPISQEQGRREIDLLYVDSVLKQALPAWWPRKPRRATDLHLTT